MKLILTISEISPSELAALAAQLGGIAVNVANDDDGDDGTAPAAILAPGTVDKTGLPWDERIHAASKAMTDAGVWRKRRNIDVNTAASVEAELRARIPAAAAPFTPPPVAPVAMTAAAFPPGNAPVYTPAAPPAPVAAAPTYVPPVAPVGGAPIDFGTLMQRIQQGVTAGKIQPAYLAELSQYAGINAITELADPAKAGAMKVVYDELVKNGLIAA